MSDMDKETDKPTTHTKKMESWGTIMGIDVKNKEKQITHMFK